MYIYLRKNGAFIFYVGTFILLFTLLLRWGSFLPSVINHDESTYIVIAGEILRGEIYLDELIDTKPAGLYWLYSLLHILSTGKIWGFRFLTVLFIVTTSLFLVKATTDVTRSRKAGIMAGLIYPLMCSVYTYYGISPNAELFFNTLTAGAIALSIPPVLKTSINSSSNPGSNTGSWEQNPFSGLIPNFIMSGLLLGLAVTIKPMAAAESLAIGVFLLWWGWRMKAFLASVFQACLPLTMAFLIPVGALYSYYDHLDMLPELYFYNWEVTKLYPVDLKLHLRIIFMLDYALRYSPFVVLAVLSWRYIPSYMRPWFYFLLLQFVLVSLIVLASGKRFGHYQIQLHPVLTSLAALWWIPKVKPLERFKGLRFFSGVTYLSLFATLFGMGLGLYYFNKKDAPRDLAAFLKPRLSLNEEFFPVNSPQILYHLLDQPVPTQYVHPSLLFNPHHVKVLGIDLDAEADRIFNRSQLRYIVVQVKDWSGENHADNPIMIRAKKEFHTIEASIDKYLVLSR